MARTRPAPARRRAAPPRGLPRPTLPPGDRGPLVGIGFAWALVLLLWAAGVWESAASVVFILALAAQGVYVIRAIVQAGAGREPLRAARRAVLLVMLVTVPLAFDPRGVEAFSPPKFTIIVVGALVLAALWAVEWARDRRPPAWRNGLQWPILALLAWTALTTFTSTNVRLSLLGAYGSYDGLYLALALGIVLFATAQAFPVRDARTALSVLFFGAGGPTLVYGVIQLHDRLAGGADWDWVRWGQVSFARRSIWSTLGNPNHFAGFLAVLLPIGLALLFVHRSWWARALIGAISASAVVAMLQATTRGAWLASLVSLPLVVLLLVRDRRARRALAVAGLVVAAGIGVGATLPSEQLGDKIRSVFEFSGPTAPAQRAEYWKAAARMGADRPLIGFGPDTFRIWFPSYQSERFIDVQGRGGVANGPHNVFMSTLASQGFPGLLAFASVLLYGSLRAVGAWRRLRAREAAEGEGEARELRLLLAGASAGLVAYVVQASFNVQKVVLSFVFWALLGVLAAIALGAGVPDTLSPRRLLAAAGPPPAPPSAEPRRPAGAARRGAGRPVLPALGAAALAAAAIVILSLLATRPWRADLIYRNAIRYEAAAFEPGEPRVTARLLELARRDFARAIKVNPWEQDYAEASAHFSARIGIAALQRERTGPALRFLREGRALFERAIALEPRNPKLQFAYARLLLTIHEADPGDASALPAAVGALRASIEANPWRPDPVLLLADVLTEQGDPAGALRALDASMAYSPDKVEVLRRAARLSEGLGEEEKAAAFWRRVLEKRPEDAEARKALGG